MSGYVTGLAHWPARYFATVGARFRKGLLGEGGARTSGACGEMKRGGVVWGLGRSKVGWDHPKTETRKPKSEGNPKPENRKGPAALGAVFRRDGVSVFRASELRAARWERENLPGRALVGAHLGTTTMCCWTFPSPRERGEGKGEGLVHWRARSFCWIRSVGLLSPTLSSRGGEGALLKAWWWYQDAPPW